MKYVFFALIFALAAGILPAQQSDSDPEQATVAALPREFRGYSLGMDLDALKDALSGDALLRFRGDRDVSFLPSHEQNLVETTGLSYIRRAFFQLHEGSLFVMAFTLDPERIDHYSVYTSFTQKYGEPDSLNPMETVWESETTRVSIERPLTVKYIDMGVFNQLSENSRTEESREVQLREAFLEAF
ncbi:hypothetical protein FACS1894151_02730 [Spirochaetia bacterium]|nr:hypothetical protein FACS1894151_02730 [Spirochaetia bacterium]